MADQGSPIANRKRKLSAFSSPVKANQTMHAWVGNGGEATSYFVMLTGVAIAKKDAVIQATMCTRGKPWPPFSVCTFHK